jgi:hypothetical protein
MGRALEERERDRCQSLLHGSTMERERSHMPRKVLVARPPMNGAPNRHAGSPEHPRDAGLFLEHTIPDMSDQAGAA